MWYIFDDQHTPISPQRYTLARQVGMYCVMDYMALVPWLPWPTFKKSIYLSPTSKCLRSIANEATQTPTNPPLLRHPRSSHAHQGIMEIRWPQVARSWCKSRAVCSRCTFICTASWTTCPKKHHCLFLEMATSFASIQPRSVFNIVKRIEAE